MRVTGLYLGAGIANLGVCTLCGMFEMLVRPVAAGDAIGLERAILTKLKLIESKTDLLILKTLTKSCLKTTKIK